MRVGLYEKALPGDWPWEKRLSMAAKAGYDFVDMSIDESDSRLARLDWTASQRAELRHAIDESGVPILTMCLSAHRKYPLGSHSSEVRREGLDILRKAIDFGSDVGMRIIQIMGYDVFYEVSDAGTQARFVEGIRQGVQWAGQAGMMLGLENVDAPFLDSVEKGLWLVDEINSPWLHLYPDMANLAAAGYHPPEELLSAAGHMVAVHVKDAQPKVIRGVPFLQGIVPFEECFRALGQAGFWGLLVVEMWADMDQNGDPFGSAAAARKLVERLVTQEMSRGDGPEDECGAC